MKGKQNNKSPQGTAASALPAIRGMRCTLSLFTLQSVAPCGTLRMVQDCTRHTDGTAACRTPPLPPSGGSGICSGDSSLDSRQNSPRLQVLLFAFFSKERKKLSLFSFFFLLPVSAGPIRPVCRKGAAGGGFGGVPCPASSRPPPPTEGWRARGAPPTGPASSHLPSSRKRRAGEEGGSRAGRRGRRRGSGEEPVRGCGCETTWSWSWSWSVLVAGRPRVFQLFVAPRLARLDIPLTCPPGAQYGPVGGPR